MQDKLQHQLRIILEENDNGNYYELTKIIISFIDQNFIGKDRLKEYCKDNKQTEHTTGWYEGYNEALKDLEERMDIENFGVGGDGGYQYE